MLACRGKGDGKGTHSHGQAPGRGENTKKRIPFCKLCRVENCKRRTIEDRACGREGVDDRRWGLRRGALLSAGNAKSEIRKKE